MSLNKYWEDRYRAEEKAREMADKSTAQQLNGIYEQNRNNIQKEIDSFWQRYTDSEGVTKLEAKQRADRLDMAVVEFRAKQLVERANRLRERGQKVTSKDFTKAENDLMKLYNLKMKTSRLEVLQANIKLHQYDLALSEFEIIDKHLTESIRRENLFSAGVLGNTLGSFVSSKVSADSLVFANFKGANWSSKLWARQNELREVVRKGVADGVLRGQGTAPLINKLKKEFDVSYSYARRLAVTESARVYSEAQKANYEANGVDEFEIMTEAKACPICQPFGGKIYKVSELVPALNAPPFHPNCRCTTVPSKYLAKDKEKMYNQSMEGMYRKRVIDQSKMSKASQEQINRLSRKFRKRGGVFISDEDAIKYLDEKKAEALTLDPYTILKRDEISISALIEELEHAEQYLRNENDGTALSVAINELNAKKKSIEERERYKLPKIEIDSVRKDIKYYEKEVERLTNENFKF